MQKIVPYLWFDRNAEEAVNFYVSVFKNSKVLNTSRYGDAGPGPKGEIMVMTFSLNGQEFGALNGGPMFTFSPGISFMVHCKTEGDLDALFKKLSPGGKIMMPLDKYPFAERYAFFSDKFGVSWQLMLSPPKEHITPCLLFVGKDLGKAEEAVKFYTSVFKNAKIDHVLKYGKGEPGKEGTVKHSSFFLEGQEFMAMDGTGPHKFDFKQSISFLINCDTQEEVDYFWENLSKGGNTYPCGWLGDKFGVPWQVVPTAFSKMMSDKDPAKVKRVMEAMLKMKKLDIPTFERAYKGV
jgi:predicted 3-demethylubiquinone-9 3-methyltransferase (glyoxalase superfamily)